MKTLVTGGAGFIGSHIVDCLVERGHDVTVIDDLSGGFAENVNPKVRFLEGSVVHAHVVERLFATWKFDYVFHTAAYAAEGLSHFIRRYNYMTNLIGSVNLINEAVKHSIKCFVFTSSIAVYGAGQLPMTEEMIPQPEDPYGISKYAVELDLEAAHKMFGLNYIIFRPHNVYGERQNIGDPYRNVVGIFMNQLLQDKPLTIFGDGEQTRAFTHISDVAPIIASSISNEDAYNQTFNIGADTVSTVNELAKQVQIAMGMYAHNVVHLVPRNEVVHVFSDHSNIVKIFNPKPPVKLVGGLLMMAEWVKKHGARQGKKFSSIEIEKNMPGSWRKMQ